MCTYDLKSSGPRVNWPTVNTYNIICNIIYTAIWCYRRCRVNQRGCVQLSLFSPAAADRETSRAYHPTFRQRRFMRNNNIKCLTALRKRKTSCSHIIYTHIYTYTHFYSGFNGIDVVLVASNDFLCACALHYVPNTL